MEAFSARELTGLRRAIKQTIVLNYKRGFDDFAGWHGVPLGWCQQHDALFLLWHPDRAGQCTAAGGGRQCFHPGCTAA